MNESPASGVIQVETIQIRCEGADKVHLNYLTEFQGDLKSLHQEDYDKLKAQILELGFCEPITVWENDGKKLIANGHQRLRVLRMMRHEGYKVPEIPISKVFPEDQKAFAHIVLSLTSQYGRIESQGTYEYMAKHGIEMKYLHERLRFPELDLPKFEMEFFKEYEVGSEDQQGQLDSLDPIEVKCPKCDTVFDARAFKVKN